MLLRRVYGVFCYYLHPWSLCLLFITHQQDHSLQASAKTKNSLLSMFQVNQGPRVSPWWAESMQSLPAIKQRVVTRHSGRDVTFRCQAFGHPRPRVTWYKNACKIQGVSRKTWQHGWRLVLPSVTWLDSGIYSCRVKNRYGEIVRHFVLDVKSRHKSGAARGSWFGRPHNLTVTTGDTAILECRTDGLKSHGHDLRSSNQHHIQWLRGKLHNFLSTQPMSQYSYMLPTSVSKLKLVDVQPSQTGYYTCLVSGVEGLRHHSAWLQVQPAITRSTESEVASTTAVGTFTQSTTPGSPSDLGLLTTKEAYIRGVAMAVAVSSVIIFGVMAGFCVAAIMQARRREDVVLEPYNLK